MLQTIRAEKVDEKNEVIFWVSMFSSRVMVLKLSKKAFFLILRQEILSLLKQFTYMHLKVFIIVFQETIWCIEILLIKISKRCWLLTKIFQFKP